MRPVFVSLTQSIMASEGLPDISGLLERLIRWLPEMMMSHTGHTMSCRSSVTRLPYSGREQPIRADLVDITVAYMAAETSK